jgi:hypothetical protein
MDEGHRAGSCLLARAGAAQVLFDRIEDEAQGAVEGLAVVLEVVAQPLGQGEHPPAHRQAGPDVIGQVGGSLRHPVGVARGADAPPLAGEGDEKTMAAVVAAGTSEPSRGRSTSVEYRSPRSFVGGCRRLQWCPLDGQHVVFVDQCRRPDSAVVGGNKKGADRSLGGEILLKLL